MFSAIKSMFGKNSNNEHNSVRSPDDISAFNGLIKKGPVTFVLVHADWCGPCQRYKPIWKDLESTPGRVANMAMVHHDMVENMSLLKKANIPGFPTVLKVYPDGRIEKFKDEANKPTNSVPHMRDLGSMVADLKTLSPKEKRANVMQPTSNFNTQMAARNRNNMRLSRMNQKQNAPAFQPPPSRTPLNSAQINPAMKGGLYNALSSALMQATPASFLFGVSQMLPPKKNRGSTKRRTRKSRTSV